MERHEIKSRVDAKLDGWKRDLNAMRIKVEASEGDSKAAYHAQVVTLEKEHEALRLKANEAFEASTAADDRWDTVIDEIEQALDDWEKGATRTRDDLLT